jgi:hypothetical protein
LVEACLVLAQPWGVERLQVRDLCVKLGVSLRKLHGAFNEVLGVPPGRYIRTMHFENRQWPACGLGNCVAPVHQLDLPNGEGEVALRPGRAPTGLALRPKQAASDAGNN